MILLIKTQEMTLRDYEMVKMSVKKELMMVDFHNFTSWHSNGKGNFKINEKHRRVLEKHLYIIE